MMRRAVSLSTCESRVFCKGRSPTVLGKKGVRGKETRASEVEGFRSPALGLGILFLNLDPKDSSFEKKLLSNLKITAMLVER